MARFADVVAQRVRYGLDKLPAAMLTWLREASGAGGYFSSCQLGMNAPSGTYQLRAHLLANGGGIRLEIQDMYGAVAWQTTLTV